MSHPPIVAHVASTEEPDSVAPVSPSEAILNAHRALENHPGTKATLDAGLKVEQLLKAYLAKVDSVAFTPKVLRSKPYQHDLPALWVAAANHGLRGVPSSPPSWLKQLHCVYGPPYVLRYGQNRSGQGLHGIVLPNQAEMEAGVTALEEAVTKAIG